MLTVNAIKKGAFEMFSAIDCNFLSHIGNNRNIKKAYKRENALYKKSYNFVFLKYSVVVL